jgi:hypothetical protein
MPSVHQITSPSGRRRECMFGRMQSALSIFLRSNALVLLYHAMLAVQIREAPHHQHQSATTTIASRETASARPLLDQQVLTPRDCLHLVRLFNVPFPPLLPTLKFVFVLITYHQAKTSSLTCWNCMCCDALYSCRSSALLARCYRKRSAVVQCWSYAGITPLRQVLHPCQLPPCARDHRLASPTMKVTSQSPIISRIDLLLAQCTLCIENITGGVFMCRWQ